MTQTHICSGLGREPCPKRETCANYVHWTLDPRSQFNACISSRSPLAHFSPIGARVAITTQIPQQELFA